MTELNQEQIFMVADRLYRYINPLSKMCTPNVAYELSDKWYNEYAMSNSKLDFYNWCIENKTPKK